MEKVEQFDPSKRKPAGKVVDLETPFFTQRPYQPRDYSKCDHSRLGFEYDLATRTIYCKCGELVDPFDAILYYARAERRLQDTRHFIEEDARKKAEEKAKKPFVKAVTGFSHDYDRLHRASSRTYTLECGHHVTQHRGRGFKRYWKTATCEKCFRAAELAKKNIAVVPSASPSMSS